MKKKPTPKTKPAAKRDSHREVEWLSLDTLKAAKRNPRDHDLGALIEALETRGLGELPLIDGRTGRLVAGHGRVDALKAMRKDGRAAPPGVLDQGKGNWVVPVITGWASTSDADAEAYLVGSNKFPELGGWDEEGLNKLLVDLAKAGGADALKGTGYDGDDVDKLLRELSADSDEKEAPIAPPSGAELYVQKGDLWRLGDHFVAQGDSHHPELRAKLFEAAGETHCAAVICDPPFAIYGSATGIGSDIADDKMVRPFFVATFAGIRERLPVWAHVYVCCDWRTYPMISETGKGSGLSAKNMLVWDKGGSGLGSMWAQSHELIAFFTLNPAPKAMKQSNGEEREARTVYKPNLLRHNRPHGEEREHNAAKPVPLLAELVEAGADKGGLVWDLFCGSGSTLMACEAMGRRCVTADLEPKWVQVAIERWQRKTGRKAEKVSTA